MARIERPRRRALHHRVHPEVSYDDDGGLTIHDSGTDLVVSIIATHPDASGPHGLTIEVYDFHGRDVLAVDTPDLRAEKDQRQGVPFIIAHHPTFSFYPENKRAPEKAAAHV